MISYMGSWYPDRPSIHPPIHPPRSPNATKRLILFPAREMSLEMPSVKEPLETKLSPPLPKTDLPQKRASPRIALHSHCLPNHEVNPCLGEGIVLVDDGDDGGEGEL